MGTLGFLSLGGAAPPDRGDDDDRKPRGPPREAVEACVDLAADDACNLVLRGEEKAGLCHAGPDESAKLACRPNDMPGRWGPPERR